MQSSRPADPAFQAWTRLIRAAERTRSAVEADLAAAGHPPLSWYDVLLELNRVARDGMRPFELEEKLLLAQYNLSRLIDRVAAAGYVEKRPAPDDRRGHIVVITAEGKRMLRRMWPAYRASVAAHVGARLGDADAGRLADLLERLYRPEKPARE